MASSSPALSKAPLAKRFLRFWFAFEPIRHTWWEGLIMRACLALIAWPTIGGPSRATSQPDPHGFATWGWDFSWVGNEAFLNTPLPLIGISMLTLWAVSLVLYALGVAPVITLVLPIIAGISHGTIGNSQGAVGHTTQVVWMVLLAAWLAAVWSQVSAWRHKPLPHQLTPGQLGLDWARQAMMATYVASAITKLMESGSSWLTDLPYFGLQIAKSTGMAYYNYLTPPDNAAWLAQFFIDHPLVAQVAIGGGLPLELLAFLALLNRRIALVYGLALISLHQILTEVMYLGFLYHKCLLLALFVNPVWWGWRAADLLGGRLKSRSDHRKAQA